MKNIKLWFTDFYEGFEPTDNYFFSLLSRNYSIDLNQQDPDYIIYSCHGNEFLNYNCIRIYYTGENLVPDFNLCDYAIGFHFIELDGRYLRYPNFALLEDQIKQLESVESPRKGIFSTKKHFCNFIYANSKADPKRDQFFNLLNDYKKVAAPGSHLNNMKIDVGERNSSDWMFSKIDFQSSCKFTIAFENSSSSGYTTEKIMHAFIANTIPIYWGNPEIHKDFNAKAFINCHDYKNFDEVVQRVKEIDQNEELYSSILAEPAFQKNKIPEQFSEEILLRFITSILEKDPEKARKRPEYGTTLKYENNLKSLISLQRKLKPILNFLK